MNSVEQFSSDVYRYYFDRVTNIWNELPNQTVNGAEGNGFISHNTKEAVRINSKKENE